MGGGGLKPGTRVVARRDFAPTVDDEMEMREGEDLIALYREENWLFVSRGAGKDEGFVPAAYVRLPACSSSEDGSSGGEEKAKGLGSPLAAAKVSSFLASLEGKAAVEEERFPRRFLGRCLAQFPFAGSNSDDLSVTPGQLLQLLNDDDPSWLWVRCEASGREGFVPANYVSRIQHSPPAADADQPTEPRVELRVREDFSDGSTRLSKGDWVLASARPDTLSLPRVPVFCPRTRSSAALPSRMLVIPPSTLL